MHSGKMNKSLMREFNIASIIQTIHQHGPISRAGIASVTNLSRPSVSDIVAQLIADGWIREIEPDVTSRGRRPTPLEINPIKRFVIGVEIGSIRASVVLSNLKAEMLKESSFLIKDFDSPELVLQAICSEIDKLTRYVNADIAQFLGVGVAMHGVVDPDTGTSIFAPNLGWENIEIKEYIESLTNLPTIVENDCNSSALGEYCFGSEKGENHFITILVDYGVGSGVVWGGEIYRGINHIEGQVGHITVDEEGPRCSCGNYGCLETVASEPSIVRQVQKRLRAGQPSTLRDSVEDPSTLTVSDVYAAARNGDTLCNDVLRSAAHYLGVGFANLINMFNPKFIVVGGGIVEVADLVLPVIRGTIESRALGSLAKKTPVFASTFGSKLYLVGAVTLVIDNAFKHPLSRLAQ